MAGAPLTIVIKVGTSSLVRIEKRSINISALALLCETVRNLREQGHHVVVVSSGAVGVGCQRLGLAARPTDLAKRQALAAAGQVHLMRYYDDFFSAIGVTCAQVMLTLDNLANPHQYANTRSTFQELFAYDIVPVVNENDTVAVEELHFGDNDTLSAKVATLVRADWLFLLTDVDALYTANPSTNPDAVPIRAVHDIAQLQVDTGARGTEWGTGGMRTKLTAARIATAAGCSTVVCSAAAPGSIARILAGEPLGTVFHPHPRALKGRKRWIVMVPCKGQLWLDAGAVAAVRGRGKSLFPAGVARVEGEFGAQDAVQLCDCEGVPFAQGLSNYAAADVAKLQGRRSQDIQAVLGFLGSEEVVHRDNVSMLALRNPPPDATTAAPGGAAGGDPGDPDAHAAGLAAAAAAAAGGAAALAAGAAAGGGAAAPAGAWEAAGETTRSDSVTSLTRPSLAGSEGEPPAPAGALTGRPPLQTRGLQGAPGDSPNPLPSPASGFRSRSSAASPTPLSPASRDSAAEGRGTPPPLPGQLQAVLDPALASAALQSSQGPIREATEAEVAARRAVIAAAKSGARLEDVTSPRTPPAEAAEAAAAAAAAASASGDVAAAALGAAAASQAPSLARADSGQPPPSPSGGSPAASPRTSPGADAAPPNFRPMSTARSSSALLLSRPSARRSAAAGAAPPRGPERPRRSLDGAEPPQQAPANPAVPGAAAAGPRPAEGQAEAAAARPGSAGLRPSLRRSASPAAADGRPASAADPPGVEERLQVLRQREAQAAGAPKRVSFDSDSRAG